jgi:hypothetical protein
VTLVTSEIVFDPPAFDRTLKATARLEGYAVILSRTVDDRGAAYSRMWALEVGPYRTVALVPASCLQDVKRAFEVGGCAYFNAAFECRGFYVRRSAPRDAR